jgi:hypothetical protein
LRTPRLLACSIAAGALVAGIGTASAATADTSVPVVTVTSPASGATVAGTIRLNVSALDPEGVTRVEYFLDGARIAYDSSAPDFSESWDTTKASEGSHTLVAKARDAAGNWGSSAPVPITVDNVADSPTVSEPTASAPNPLTCDGYPEKRVFLDSQSWWYDSRSQTDGESSHVHAGTCFPLYQTISGKITFDLRVLVHNDRGVRVNAVRVSVNEPGGAKVIWTDTKTQPRCDEHDCTFWWSPTIDLSALNYGGLLEFRFHAETTRPDGDVNRATNGWFAFVDNGKSVGTTAAVRAPSVEARGWYEVDGRVLGYENALFRSKVPFEPVCGTWRVKAETKAGADGGITPTSSVVALDPNLHAGIRGTVLYDGSGALMREFAIDTTKLANGPHKLMIASRADRETDKRLAGALVVPFTVDNSLPCATLPVVDPMWYPNARYSSVSSSSTDVLLDAFASGASKIEYLIDGKVVTKDSSGPNFSTYYDLSLLAAGTHSLVARATIGGLVHASAPVPFSVRK